MKTNRLALLPIAILSTSALAAVYEQPSQWQSTGDSISSGWTSHVDAGLNGGRAYERFSVAANTTIGQATWRGIYLDLNLNDAAPNTTVWDIGIFADNAGAPGGLLSTTSLASAQVTRQTLGTGQFAHTTTVYEFMADISDFNLTAGTAYWFSPQSKGGSFTPFFSWIAGSGGDGFTYQQALSGGAVTSTFPQRSEDRAFALLPVPEPSTWAAVGALAFMVGMVWHRRKA